jgi:hypothetical protein
VAAGPSNPDDMLAAGRPADACQPNEQLCCLDIKIDSGEWFPW